MERMKEDDYMVMSICTPDLGITEKGYITRQSSQKLFRTVVLDGSWILAEPFCRAALVTENGRTYVTTECRDGMPVEMKLLKR